MHEGLDVAITMLSIFGGTSLIIWTSVQAKIARIKAEAQARQQSTPLPEDGAILAEMKAMRQQMEQMQSTSHGFDLSFDEALSRLEGRVGRLETKNAASVANAPAEATLRNGNSSTP